ncbi:MAG: hypothetical protein KBH81_04325 [Phycisphaerae bacterium]|jgi:hypothetical protein|nr:hypothetical protein [Phycisphaerae bacterium]HOO17631.1 hypothetical protein [Phycisphaerae bacterium]HRS28004.1 hypothetical protein [Phycisphaerae bacterium]HRT42570.1 hypothetical protein [Phycisphaerae bacterium]
MYARRKIAGLMILVGVPLLAAVLWLASGRETFTKSGRAVEVAVRDPLFGDMVTETRLERGPIFGYYIGLDLLLLALLLAVVVGAVWWLLARHRRRLDTSAKEATP